MNLKASQIFTPMHSCKFKVLQIKTLFYIIDLLYQSFDVLNHNLIHMSFQFANSGNTKPSMLGLQQKAGQNCMSVCIVVC